MFNRREHIRVRRNRQNDLHRAGRRFHRAICAIEHTAANKRFNFRAFARHGRLDSPYAFPLHIHAPVILFAVEIVIHRASAKLRIDGQNIPRCNAPRQLCKFANFIQFAVLARLHVSRIRRQFHAVVRIERIVYPDGILPISERRSGFSCLEIRLFQLDFFLARRIVPKDRKVVCVARFHLRQFLRRWRPRLRVLSVFHHECKRQRLSVVICAVHVCARRIQLFVLDGRRRFRHFGHLLENLPVSRVPRGESREQICFHRQCSARKQQERRKCKRQRRRDFSFHLRLRL